MNPYGHPLSHPDALPISEVAYETSASDRVNPPVGSGQLRFLSTLWHWAFRILVLRLSSLWLLTLRLSNVRVWGVRAAMLCLMECCWLSWVLGLWPIPGLRRFDREASAPWPSPTCRSRECWTLGRSAARQVGKECASTGKLR